MKLTKVIFTAFIFSIFWVSGFATSIPQKNNCTPREVLSLSEPWLKKPIKNLPERYKGFLYEYNDSFKALTLSTEKHFASEPISIEALLKKLNIGNIPLKLNSENSSQCEYITAITR